MFERPDFGERVLLVQISLPPFQEEQTAFREFESLAMAAGAEIMASEFVKCVQFNPKYFIGSGKVSEIKQIIQERTIDLVIFNQSLSPAQERNLESTWQCRVLDRTGLILDIFAKRARSFEGKLQVELAQLSHLATRLIRGWSHLERQKGGIGLRGPGEKQLELDRRMLHERIKSIYKRLAKVQSQRKQSRRARQRALLPTVAIVGYTNAGKSTLFNQLTNAKVHVEDQLFATLDPTLRKIMLPKGGHAILSDTVGFIRHLPDNLVEAFKATLEEITTSDLLLHVVDAADPMKKEKMDAVETVLTTIDAAEIKQIQVFNKVDCLDNSESKLIWLEKNLARIWVSAEKNLGIEHLLEIISKQLYGAPIERTVILLPSESKLRAKLYDIGAVFEEQITQSGEFILKTSMTEKDYQFYLGDRKR